MTDFQEQQSDSASKPRAKRSRWKILFWVSAIIAILVAIVIIAMPFIIRWQLEKALAQQGAIHARIQDVDFNPFYGKLVIEAFRGYPDTEHKKLAVARAVINVNWLPLWEKRIFVSDLVLQDVELRVERHPDGGWSLGDLKIPATQDQQPPAREDDEQQNNWTFGLGRLLMENVLISYHDPQLDVQTQIHRAQAGRLVPWEPDQSTPFSLSLTLKSGTLEIEGEATPFSAYPTGRATLVMQKMPVGWLQPTLAAQEVRDLGGTVSSELKIAAEKDQKEDLTVTTEGRLELASGRLQHPAATVQEGIFNWEGQIFLRLPPGGAEPEWSLEGDARISADNLQWTAEENALAAGGALDASQRIHAARRPDGNLEADLRGQLEVREGHFENPDLAVEQTDLSWDGTLSLAKQTDPSLQFRAAGLLGARGLRINLHAAGLAVSDEQLRIDLETELTGSESPGESLNARLDVNAGPLQIDDLERELRLLQSAGFTIEGFQATGLHQLSVQHISFNDIAALERADKGIPDSPDTVLRTDQIELKNLALNDLEHLSATSIVLTSMSVWLQREQDGTLEISRWFAGGEQEARPAEADEESAPIQLTVKEISLEGENHLNYFDNSVSPEVRETVSQLNLSLSDLDMTSPTRPTRVSGKARIGENGHFSLDGTIQPFREEISTDLLAKLENLNLSPLDGYVRDAIGYRLKSGRLSGEIIGKAESGTLDSQLDLFLEKLEIDPLSEQQRTETTANLGVPLGSALNLLREKEGNIHLEVPIEGDLSDPQFQFGKVIQSAIFKALKTGVVSYYAPLGVSLLTGASLPAGALWAAGKLFDMATALRFDPLIFEPGISQLTPAQKNRLKEMAALLADRPEVDLVVCGIATPQDLRVMREQVISPETSKKKAKEQADGPSQIEGTPPAPTDQEQQALYDLASGRMDAVRNSLLEQGVTPDRLVTCSPDYQRQAEAQPRVELGI